MMEQDDAYKGSKAVELQAKRQVYQDYLDQAQVKAKEITEQIEQHTENAKELRDQRVESFGGHNIRLATRRLIAQEILEKRNYDNLDHAVSNEK